MEGVVPTAAALGADPEEVVRAGRASRTSARSSSTEVASFSEGTPAITGSRPRTSDSYP